MKYIRANAFIYNDIKIINFPNSLIEIGTCSFLGNKITEIILGKNIERINSKAFALNPLKSMDFDENIILGKEIFFNIN